MARFLKQSSQHALLLDQSQPSSDDAVSYHAAPSASPLSADDSSRALELDHEVQAAPASSHDDSNGHAHPQSQEHFYGHAPHSSREQTHQSPEVHAEDNNSPRVDETIDDVTTVDVVLRATRQYTIDSVKLQALQFFQSLTLASFIPAVRWLKQYPASWRQWLLRDVICGLTLSVLLIPQSLAYALLATLPANYGLYACLAPPVIYVLLGSSRELHIGPFALISLLTATAIQSLISGDAELDDTPETHVQLALSISMVVGIMLLAMGVLRLGWVVNFLSTPMLRGLNVGAGYLIATSQVKTSLGMQGVPRTVTLVEPWIYMLSHLSTVSLLTTLLSVGCISLLLLCDYLTKRLKLSVPIPGQLLVVIISTVIVWSTDASEAAGIQIVGAIETGFPAVYVPTPAMLQTVFVASLPIALVVYFTSISAAKQYATKRQYRISNNAELVALGMCNIIGSFLSAYPSSASLSRTALVDKLNPATQVHQLVSTAVAVLAIVAIMPTLSQVPQCCLAAIIVVALKSLLSQVTEGYKYYQISTPDCIMWSVTFLATVFGGTEIGLITGIAVCLASLLYIVSVPTYSVVSGGADDFADNRVAEQSSDIHVPGGVVIVRYDGPLLFSNAEHFRGVCTAAVTEARDQQQSARTASQVQPYSSVTVEQSDDERETSSPTHHQNGHDGSTAATPGSDAHCDATTVHTLIVDCISITRVDTTALSVLKDLSRQLNVALLLANARAAVSDLLDRSEHVNRSKLQNTLQLFDTVGDAVHHAAAAQRTSETRTQHTA